LGKNLNLASRNICILITSRTLANDSFDLKTPLGTERSGDSFIADDNLD